MLFELSFRLIAFVSLQIFASFQADFSSLKDAFNTMLVQPPSALRNLQSSLGILSIASVANDRPHSGLPTGCGQSFATHSPICLVIPIPEPPPPPPPVPALRSKTHIYCDRCYPFYSPACPFVPPSKPVPSHPRHLPLSGKIFNQFCVLIISLLHTFLPIIFPPHLATLAFLQNLCENLKARCHQLLPNINLHKYKLFNRQSPVCIKTVAERYRLRYLRKAKLLTKQVQRYRRRNLTKNVTVKTLRDALSRSRNAFVSASEHRNMLIFENSDLRKALDSNRQREASFTATLGEQGATIRSQDQQIKWSRRQHLRLRSLVNSKKRQEKLIRRRLRATLLQKCEDKRQYAAQRRASDSARRDLISKHDLELKCAKAVADERGSELSSLRVEREKQLFLTESYESRIEAIAADLECATTSSRAVQQEVLNSKLDCDRWREEAAALRRGILTLDALATESNETLADVTRLRHYASEDLHYQIALVLQEAMQRQLALTEAAELERRGLEEENVRLAASLEEMTTATSILHAELVLRQAELDATRQAVKVSDAACVQIAQAHWKEVRQLEAERGLLEAKMADMRDALLIKEDITEECRALSLELQGIVSDADKLCGETADLEFRTRDAVTALEIEKALRLEEAENSRILWETVQAEKRAAQRKLATAVVDNATLVAQIADLVAEVPERSAVERKTVECLECQVMCLEDENIRLAAILEDVTEGAGTLQAQFLLQRAEVDETREAVKVFNAACMDIAELHWQEARQWDAQRVSLEEELADVRNALLIEEAMNEEACDDMVQQLQSVVSDADELSRDIVVEESHIRNAVTALEQAHVENAQYASELLDKLVADKAAVERRLAATVFDNGLLVSQIADLVAEVPERMAADQETIERLEEQITTLSDQIRESNLLKERYKGKFDTSEVNKVEMQNRVRELEERENEFKIKEVALRAGGLNPIQSKQLQDCREENMKLQKALADAELENQDLLHRIGRIKANVKGLSPSSNVTQEGSSPSSSAQHAAAVPIDVIGTNPDEKGDVSSPRAAAEPSHPEASQEGVAPDGPQKDLSTVLRAALAVETPEPEGTSHKFKLRPVERPRKREEVSAAAASPLHLARQALKPVNRNGQTTGKSDRRVLGDMTNEQK